MQEQEYESYYLRDFIYFALKGWRKIIVFAVIGALLLAGIALYRQRDLPPAARIPDKIEAEDVTLTDEELAAVRADVIAKDVNIIRYNKRAEFLRTRVDTLAERLSNSVYLAIDEKNQPIGSFDLVISMDNITAEPEEIIEQRHLLLTLDYLNSARSNSFYTYLERENSAFISGANLRELVEINLQEGNIIHFEITAQDMVTARQLSEAARNFIFLELDNQSTYVYPHSINIENESYETVHNPKIAQERRSMEARLEDASEELEEIEQNNNGYDVVLEEKVKQAEEQARIDKAEKLNEEAQREAKKEEKREESGEGTSTSVNVPLYTVGGLVVGILAALLWNFYRGASAGKLMHPDDFANRIGLLYINEIIVPAAENENKNKRFGAVLDRLIERLYLRPKLQDAEPMQAGISYAATVIEGLYEAKAENAETGAGTETGKSSEASTIAVLSADDSYVIEAIAALNKEAAQNDTPKFRLLPAGSISADISAIDTLTAADSALVLARPRKTEMQELLRSLEMTQQLKKPILGLISIEQID